MIMYNIHDVYDIFISNRPNGWTNKLLTSSSSSPSSSSSVQLLSVSLPPHSLPSLRQTPILCAGMAQPWSMAVPSSLNRTTCYQNGTAVLTPTNIHLHLW